jgi:hypothetical protein
MRNSSKVMARKLGIENVGRDRGGAVGRADGAGDETLAAVLVLRDARGLARQPRAFEVQFVGDLRHAVIGLRDAGRGERVGRDDVGAGAEIGEMDGAHRVRPAEIEEIVVAAHLAVPGVEARAAIASSSSPSAWIIVPMAPSSTRMRSAARRRSVVSLVGIGH